MYLLKEYSSFEYDAEEVRNAEPNKPLLVKGVLQRGDTLNQNGRIYPVDILAREIKYYKETKVDTGQALGELDHADNPIVSMQKVSHIIRDITIDGNGIVKGTVEILDTPCGNIVRSLLKAGIKPGISSRALGSVKKVNEVNVVQDDLQIICWDFVGEPSTPGAYMMMSEARELNKQELEAFYKTQNKTPKNSNILSILDSIIQLNKGS